MPGTKVDGNDVLAVYSVVEKAVLAARSGSGPSFVECKTFRMTGHSAHDAAEYVPEKLFAQWKKKDPIARLEKVLLAGKILNTKQVGQMDEEVRKQVDEAIAYAEAGPFPEGTDVREGVYCDDDCWWKDTSSE
jgi:pyruvate dehydrogenase E1 component alpha subunit